MCGEKRKARSRSAYSPGSPPRVRGKGRRSGSRAVQTRDHPRVCGEKRIATKTLRGSSGSPPRVRGKVRVAHIVLLARGITPACAGKSVHGHPVRLQDEDHPRVCGEKDKQTPEVATFQGSPPRVRGKGSPICTLPRPRRDHPRVCGEKAVTCMTSLAEAGSPPRVRGKAFMNASPTDFARITPACAGKSFYPSRSVAQYWDHPRVCGEKSIVCVSNDESMGSPPRVRGKGQNTDTQDDLARITPACAGKSRNHPRGRSSARDHPRVCGEKYSCVSSLICALGSPPRVRGKVQRGMP